jgi:hypothetical protein
MRRLETRSVSFFIRFGFHLFLHVTVQFRANLANFGSHVDPVTVKIESDARRKKRVQRFPLQYRPFLNFCRDVRI